MASTHFTDNITLIMAEWLNDVDLSVYTTVPALATALVGKQNHSGNLDTYAGVTPTAAGLALLNAANAAAQRTTLGLALGTDVQAYDVDIPTVAASQAEMETGTETAIRSMSPLRVAQAIAALSNSGSVVQELAVSTNSQTAITALIPFDNTTPQNTEGTEFLTLAITPRNANNKLVIEFTMPAIANSGAAYAIAALFKDSTVFAIGAGAQYLQGESRQISLRTVVPAGSTSAITFKIRLGITAGASLYPNYPLGGCVSTTLTIREISV